MGFACNRRALFLGVLSVLFSLMLVGVVGAQGLPSLAGQSGPFTPFSPSTAPQPLMAPSPLGAPGSAYGAQPGSDIIPLSSGMFGGIIPRIPNLELGFLYNFGQNVRMGRFSADYVLPFSLSPYSVIFGEAHGEWEDFWKTPKVSVEAAPGFTVTTSGTSNRVDLSFGGGYRTLLGANTLVGANGFYDSSRIFNKWYSSGGVGLEMAALVCGDAAIDLNVNWYGNLFSRDGLINAFRNKGNSYDVEAGYSQSLFNQAVDLRLKATGYQFDIGTAVYGWRTGADLTTRDGVLSLRYEYGHDGVNGSYNTVGGFVNIGFQLQNILSGENPFTLPEPVFASPRNLRRMLTQKVKRDWHQPAAAILLRQAATQQGAAGPTGPYFVFSLGGVGLGTMTYAQDPGNATGTMHVSASTLNFAANYSLTLVGTTGLTFPLVTSVSASPANASAVTVRQDGNPNAPEFVIFPTAVTLTRTVPPNGASPGGVPVPRVQAGAAGTQGTITIMAPGVQTLTITIVAP